MSRLKAWWNQPDPFDWTSSFLRGHGLLRSAQVVMAIVTSSSGLVAISVFARPPTVSSLLIGGGGVAFCAGMAWFWLTRWPTRRLSHHAVVVGIVFVAGWVLIQPNAGTAILGCTAMAITGAYIAFFHSTKLLAANLAVAFAVTIATAIRIAHDTSLAEALIAVWLVWLLNLVVPLTIRGTSQAMGAYAVLSDEDPLTGLLNRRGFIDAIMNQLALRRPSDSHLTVLMVDLDDFKVVNDTRGHAAGDRALLAVAELLRRDAPPNAAICRAGGEEFLVSFISASADARHIAAPLCTSIARLPQTITASIGVASAELNGFADSDCSQLIEQLIATADSAMYAAKRNGGNQIQHS
ncbi:MAG TPA: GGDEF domain-containing protein [Mycobacterium sp.]|nr:GGDEF domain-containing protein [Mycobacterium sp.]